MLSLDESDEVPLHALVKSCSHLNVSLKCEIKCCYCLQHIYARFRRNINENETFNLATQFFRAEFFTF